ncbi:TetR/AcrR family transcriptional regulator [Gordonia sp. TBRC 11910]|uniref:TetR/AcrR family transcriptional regulator n=1 Tax=Gordonia asplenii TaxID=2725283 RepID=A0A848KQY6_9ACTN|nr:TetR/AcrR family transcriptional regulator [Gordonia asplenii]NMO00469.1 TetR/AcrR family transcriptional regulator [Gordonia asplenii]
MSDTATRTSPEAAQRRAAIVAVARRQAIAGGYEGVTIRSVATQAHTTPVTIYRYFGSKSGLLSELMVEWADATITRLADYQRSTPAADTPSAVATGFANIIEWAAADRNLLSAGLRALNPITRADSAAGPDSGVNGWLPMFTKLVGGCLDDPQWHDDARALTMGHVLIACVSDLVMTGDTARVAANIATAARQVFVGT